MNLIISLILMFMIEQPQLAHCENMQQGTCLWDLTLAAKKSVFKPQCLHKSNQ
jgi:hypothetical protein